MSRGKEAPPPILDDARVLEFAIIDENVHFAGRALLFVDKEELGPASRVAVCENLSDKKVLLFHCDPDFTVTRSGRF